MKVEILSKKLIKPRTPTPTHLRTYKLSYLDQTAHPINGCFTFYYANYYDTINERIDKLEASLAHVLSRFYPLAGRYIKENYTVDCNDEGAEFVEACVDCNLHEIINNSSMKIEELYDLLPRDHCAVDEVTDPLLAIQVSKFKCGGLAICVIISHRVFDGASISTFIAAWTSMHRGDYTNQATFPTFNASLLFPIRNITSHDSETEKKINSTIVCKRFLFNKNAISILRAKMMTSQALGKRPLSKVRLVFGLMVKVLASVDQKKYGKSRGLVVYEAINFRERIVPPLSKYACGNLVTGALTQCTATQCQNMEYPDFVRSLGDSVIKTLAACGQLSSDLEKMIRALIDAPMELIERSYKNGVNVLWFSDFTKFGFYEADFGWGKPIWVSLPNMYTENFFLLMDHERTDQIEAWVHLDKKDMAYLEEDEELKLLTTSLAVQKSAAL